ncbi:hypothetical protein [Sphingomonas mollis]|uniref:Uncharacterized protein n=1 Tax=Sphingomonas mollis TaxID=2795726 RepID=A0ABS0XRG3_9SPHN|nr:hypothetical protein [Sphingomonas sp. BT553]MBJ6122637.1 hypothetical protein [Sphingomonas sp. BT553]
MIALMLAAAPFTSAADHLRIERPAGAQVSRTLDGRSLMAAGWRLMWDGKPAGPGNDVVRFTIRARPTDGVGVVDEMLQIGIGKPGSARDCLTRGLRGGSARKLPDRLIDGRRWTAWSNGDAGMSQQITATDLRTVYRNRCYAVARIGYAVKAMDTPRGLPAQAMAAAAMDRALATLRLK